MSTLTLQLSRRARSPIPGPGLIFYVRSNLEVVLVSAHVPACGHQVAPATKEMGSVNKPHGMLIPAEDEENGFWGPRGALGSLGLCFALQVTSAFAPNASFHPATSL